MSLRVLVTGASGFIGQPLVASLIGAGCDVIGAARSRPEHDPGLADWVDIDLLAEDPAPMVAGARADVLVNLAWIATPGVYAASPENLGWLSASAQVCAAFLAAGGRQVVGVGTCLEYDLGDGAAPSGPRTLYASTKHACRVELERQVAATPGATLAWARVFYLLGALDDPQRFAPSLARRLVAGEPVEMSRGLIVRDFIDVRDCARALTGLATSGAHGTFDVGAGVGRRLRDVAEMIALEAGRPDLLSVNPALDRAGERETLIADPGALVRSTGALPAYSIEQSVRDLIQHYRDRRAECA